MSRILLDTHLLLWAVAEPRKLPPAARKRIEEAEVFVSAASIWEVSIKAALGKLAADPAELLAEIEPAGFRLLPVTGEHAAAVARLPRAPADEPAPVPEFPLPSPADSLDSGDRVEMPVAGHDG